LESHQHLFWCALSIAPPFIPIQCLPGAALALAALATLATLVAALAATVVAVVVVAVVAGG